MSQSNKFSNVFELNQRLNHYKVANPKSEDWDEQVDNRHTYCHLGYYIAKDYADRQRIKPGWHKFEVRHWHTTMDYRMIELSCVNWTCAAGTCSVTIKDDTIHLWKIWEDEPTLQVLF